MTILQNDTNFFGRSTPSVRISTAVSEELVLDDPNSIDTLRSLLGFPSTVEPETCDVRMQVIMGLVHKRFTDQSNASFKVYPPLEVIEDPTVVASDDVVERLKDKQFQVVFNDETSEILSLAELIMFTENLIFVAIQMQELTLKARSYNVERANFTIQSNVFPHRMLMPELVKLLFTKINLEDTPFLAR